MKIENLKVYDFKESIIASGYPMQEAKDQKSDYNKDLQRVVKLASTPTNSGHGNFLTGIRVSFDLTTTVTMMVQMERYHFFDIVSSQSTMHKLNKFDLDLCFSEFTDGVIITRLKELIKRYNANQTRHNFNIIADSCPKGIELKMRISTNYMQIKNMIQQRKGHRLFVWDEFCKYMLLNLPMANDLL